ncbi:unnamed protein product [Kuraishia capsulata CBS 1993]|uniref:Putative gamma-glutamylcyclotransferase n=1 Tax=Kuraishia capsulata CBS 1993 TaxID=1382522 RepID=W6MIM5_9ASCO|nr:uncharacterized protein KUCA_T00001962001 [Kuraishia capsulata CBS 1993]CDK25991.1 unnamed protein product [Kuraishia capsulata CBS 1993]
MSRSLFSCYGTLMNPRIALMVLKGDESGNPDQLEFTDAVLKSYRRCMLKNAKYPAVFASEGHSVEGVLIRNLRDSDLQFLDWYEGSQFERRPANVECDGTTVETEFYLWVAANDELLENDWDDSWMNDPAIVKAYMKEELESLEDEP